MMIIRTTLMFAFTFACVTIVAQPVISFTFDDGVTDDMPGYPFAEWNGMLLDNLDRAKIRSVFFVTGNNKNDDLGQALLRSWSNRGHRIGNHTWSHPNYGSAAVTYEKFKKEFLSTDSVISQYPGYIQMFRFPYLKEGDTREKIDSARSLLKKSGYRNGYVTIDASDWYIASRLRMRLRKKPKANVDGYRKFYLEHLYERAMYYEDLAFKLTGRNISHTMLLHHNLASALFLDDLIDMFKSKGWKVISADEAYRDPIFEKQPANIPAGESLIWALAKESGKFEAVLRYPAEDSKYEEARMNALGL
ncbi:polysaccharide deacetylase family protein [Chryseolinea sp. T2]|uniref:polysaccharide deacetylase family protein n=1 Tax=Chryseolinea sp. T2 TaxID=3129255 RepID=UPI0030785F72